MNKIEIIDNYSKQAFLDFLVNDHNGRVLKLFDDEGIKILMNSSLKSDRIRYVLVYSNYREQLLQNDKFLDVLFMCDVSDFYAVLKSLSFDVSNKLFKKYINIENDSRMIANFFGYFSLEFQLKMLDDWVYSQEVLYDIINASDQVLVIQKILDKYGIDLSNKKIELFKLFEKSKEALGISILARNLDGKSVSSINILSSLITRKVAKRIWDDYDIFGARKILNIAQFSTDISLLNDYFKEKEDKIISEVVEESLVSPYDEIFIALSTVNSGDDEADYMGKFYSFVKASSHLIRVEDERVELYRRFREEGFNSACEYLKLLSDRTVSNYIIDYHFEENFHNIMLDMRELLRFYYDGNIVIQSAHVELYEKIVNIDYLPVSNKKELHELLKKVNMMEMFYDDMVMARHVVAEAIKEYSLTSESLQRYKNVKLSEKLGVDVFQINDEPFFGIVKTGRRFEDMLPTGHSYSLVGRGGVAVFGDEKASSTFLYDSEDLNSDQIVHTFPFDSFTFFRPFNINESRGSNKVNTLLMPEELVGVSPSYNEILILEQGIKQTDIDKDIPRLKEIALYCIDEITEKDIEIAKRKGVGIFLVSSKRYLDESNKYAKKFLGHENQFRYEYFDGIYNRTDFENTR